MKFKVGDIVRLISGSPLMTVFSDDISYDDYICIYFNEVTGLFEQKRFRRELLVLVEKIQLKGGDKK